MDGAARNALGNYSGRRFLKDEIFGEALCVVAHVHARDENIMRSAHRLWKGPAGRRPEAFAVMGGPPVVMAVCYPARLDAGR